MLRPGFIISMVMLSGQLTRHVACVHGGGGGGGREGRGDGSPCMTHKGCEVSVVKRPCQKNPSTGENEGAECHGSIFFVLSCIHSYTISDVFNMVKTVRTVERLD